MNRPLVVLRPEPGCSETVEAARELGLVPLASPLFEIEPVAWQAPPAGGFDAIAAGSANVFRCGGTSLAALRGLPVHAVGRRTAEAAREAGFAVDSVGEGGLQSLIGDMKNPMRVLRLAGEARVDLSPPPGVEVVDVVVYRAAPRPLSPDAAAALGKGAVAALHSAEAARHFASECDRLRLGRAAIRIAALAPRIAESAGAGWERVAVAETLSDGALLALAHDMCQWPSKGIAPAKAGPDSGIE